LIRGKINMMGASKHLKSKPTMTLEHNKYIYLRDKLLKTQIMHLSVWSSQNNISITWEFVMSFLSNHYFCDLYLSILVFKKTSNIKTKINKKYSYTYINAAMKIYGALLR